MNEFTQALTQIGIQAIVATLVVVVTFLKTGVIHFLNAKAQELKTKKTAQEYNLIREICFIGVNFVEQISKNLDIKGKDKLDHATEYILAECQRRNLPVKKENIVPIVEAILNGADEVKNEVLDVLTEPVE